MDESLKPRRGRWSIGSGELTLLALVLAGIGWWAWPARHDPFDAAKWRAAATSHDYESRWTMVDDVRRRLDAGEWPDLAGVRAALGEPDSGSLDAGPSSVRYELGPEHRSIIKMDGDYLSIDFDEKGKVVGHAVRTS